MHSVKEARARLEAAKGKKAALQQYIRSEKQSISLVQQEAEACTGAQLILQESARLTQSQLEYRISKLVTLAMESVFNEPYEIKLVFENSRGKTAANLFFERDGEPIDPLDASGGGAVDVAAFGLQVSLWTLQSPRTRNVLILDEPLKWLKGGVLPEKGAEMLQQISHKLGLQIIMVSHIPDQIEHADRVFRVSMKNRISTIKQEK